MLNNIIKVWQSPMPSSIYYWWNFGSLLGFCLLFQMFTGLFLSMFYENSMEFSFLSISNIERNINFGWLIRALHANGASMFFIFVYLHIGRGLYFKSFYMILVWLTGCMLLLLLFVVAFIGYVLPWGQMSFWGATVITNLVSSFPYVGKSMTFWIWGNFSVSKATLMRFFTFHFLFPMLMMLIAFLHVVFLHTQGSSSPLGCNSLIDKIPFYPFFFWKDILGFIFILFIFMSVVVILPFFLMDPDNFIPANPMVTPPHIQPEWYFLFAYAILRTIPNKLGGVIFLMFSILILMFLILIPNFFSKNIIVQDKFIFKVFYFFWICNFLFLTFMGSMTIESPFIFLSKMSSFFYFLFYLIFL